MTTVNDLVYDPDRHATTTRDGRDVPHVTHVLGAVGVSTNFEQLAALAFVDIELARLRGSAVHADCHAYDDNDLALSDCDPRVRPYVQAWATFRENKGLTPLSRERRIFEPIYWYTGFLDGVFLNHLHKRILIDIKTGDPFDAAAHLQTSAYERAWNRDNPEQTIDERWAVWLIPERKIPYRVFNYTAAPDADLHFGKFAACLTTYNEQPERRGRI
jgi:hypothetical protein